MNAGRPLAFGLRLGRRFSFCLIRRFVRRLVRRLVRRFVRHFVRRLVRRFHF